VDPSFSLDGDLLVPSMSSVSVWSEDMVNGHQVGGLVAWAVERDRDLDGMQLTRLTIDMFRPVPMKPLRIETRVPRQGRRLQIVEVSIVDDGSDVEVTRGSALLLRRADAPAGEPWAPPLWDAPAPEEIEGPATPSGQPMISWEIRRIDGDGDGRSRVWMRELVPFVGSEEPSPVVRAALAADYANPLVNMAGSHGLAYINADVTLYLSRDPVDEWIGMEAIGHVGGEGIGLGSAWIYDRAGRIGHASVAGMPDPRLRERLVGVTESVTRRG
jgi:Thioesterase-like superfamily